MRLDLPSPVPLPDDVRHRALDAVLAGIDDPAPRRVGWAPVLLAAAVAVALVLGVSVAIDRWSDPTLQVATPPAPTVDADVQRCADAVESAGRADEYPPRAQWRATEGGSEFVPDRFVAINDSFACLLTPVSVSVSPVRGTPMGDASLVRLGPAVLAVLNPQRRVVSSEGLTGLQQPTAASVIPVLLDGIEIPDDEVVVEGSYAGPLPAPLLASSVDDRSLATRVYGTADSNDMDACLSSAPSWQNSRPELWQPVGRHDLGDATAPVLLARIADLHAGFCVLAADGGPRFVAGALPRPEDPRPQVVAYEPADGERTGFLSSVLLTVPDSTVRVEIDSNPPDGSGSGSQGAPCTIVDGLAFCADGGPPEDNTIYLFDEPDGPATNEVRPGG